MRKLVKAGHFKESDEETTKPEKRASRQTPKKKGAAFAAVQESDEESDDERSAEHEKPTFEEFCRQQGFIQANVGVQRAWDGDTVSDLEFGIGCLNVGTQASPVTHEIELAGASNAPIGSPNE